MYAVSEFKFHEAVNSEFSVLLPLYCDILGLEHNGINEVTLFVKHNTNQDKEEQVYFIACETDNTNAPSGGDYIGSYQSSLQDRKRVHIFKV